MVDKLLMSVMQSLFQKLFILFSPIVERIQNISDEFSFINLTLYSFEARLFVSRDACSRAPLRANLLRSTPILPRMVFLSATT